jgi:hypothetical protein
MTFLVLSVPFFSLHLYSCTIFQAHGPSIENCAFLLTMCVILLHLDKPMTLLVFLGVFIPIDNGHFVLIASLPSPKMETGEKEFCKG